LTWWDESPCGEYTIEEGPRRLYVVLTFSDGSSVFAQGDSHARLIEEWAACREVGDFSIFEEYRPEVDA
jgi:hypothetical protein